MPIHLRLATAADVPAIARIGSAAFHPSTDRMAAAFFPAHLQRPGHDAHQAWRAARKSARVGDAGSILMVAVEGSGSENEMIVGYSWWTRPGAESNVASVIGASEEGLRALGETFPPELDRDAVTNMRKGLLAGEEAVFGAGVQRHWYGAYFRDSLFKPDWPIGFVEPRAQR